MNQAFAVSAISESPDLLARARSGDADAFGALCRIHGPRLVRQAVLMCGNAATAEDLSQEAFFQAWKNLHRYNGQCRLFTWLCAILLNCHRRSWRKSRRFPGSLISLAHSAEPGSCMVVDLPDGTPRPDQAMDSAERNAFLRRCVDQLPPKQREVIHLRFYVDDSLEGIATALGCSVGTVKSRLFHALDRLRSMKRPGSPQGEPLLQSNPL